MPWCAARAPQNAFRLGVGGPDISRWALLKEAPKLEKFGAAEDALPLALHKKPAVL